MRPTRPTERPSTHPQRHLATKAPVIIASGERAVIREEPVAAKTTGVKLGVRITCLATSVFTLANG